MLDNNEIQQVRHTVITEMADVAQASHNHHGSYTHLCAINDELVYTHQACGRVIYEFNRRIYADEVE
jgi:hypothetical protein